jgi:hypothetical protein
MRRQQSTARRVWKKAMPWVIAWGAVQVAIRVAGTVLASRRNAGDEQSSEIRRFIAQGGAQLKPRSPDLTRVDLELLMSGVDLDLSHMPAKPPGGVDVNVTAAMAGVQVTVPADWKVWWESSGVGGMDSDRKREPLRAATKADADVRVTGRLLFAGTGIAAAPAS